MDIMELGAIGELVGGVAVIATLVYLAIQVRHGTRAARSAAYQAAVTSVAEFTRLVGSDPATAALFHNGLQDPSRLADDQRIQWAFLFTSAVRNFENLHYQHEIGSLDEAIWGPWAARIRGIFRTPGARAWWTEQRPAYSSAFQAFVEDSSGSGVPVFSNPASGSGAA